MRERHGVYFDGSSPLEDNPVAPYGKDFADPANLPFWWSLGALGMWPLAEVSVATANEFRLWETSEFGEINLLAQLNDYDPAKIRVWEQERAAVINFGFLSRGEHLRLPRAEGVDGVGARPPLRRDARPGPRLAGGDRREGDGVHQPSRHRHARSRPSGRDDSEPGYWTGEASMPRSAQYQGTAVHIYQPKWDESTDPLVWGVFEYRPFTHAYVPQDHFDEVRQVGNWTIAAKNGGYIALWSWRTPTWREYDPAVVATNGMTKPFDLVAEGGPDNVWLVEVGSDDGGTLDDFVAALTADRAVGRARRHRLHRVVDVAVGGHRRLLQHRPVPDRGRGATARRPPPPRVAVGRHRTPSRQYNLTAGDSTWSNDFDAMTRSVS